MRCAWDVQKELKTRNAELPENRRMNFRIGVNLGDVIEEGDRIYGDGVNIAARLEGLAEAGGICISGTAYDQVKNKLPFSYEYGGEQTVKNIVEPVRVYRVLIESDTVAKKLDAKKAATRKWIMATVSVFGAIILVVLIVIIYNLYLRPETRSKSIASELIPEAELSKKPSIAVLPFENFSEDPEQAFFSDGLTEDLITGLSKIKEILVIARNSTFAYKGKSVKIQKVAEELGVKYVLEGSVRRSEDEVRINAQLIDATTGSHIWAERYDGKMSDIFALQDQINDKIISALAVKLTAVEKERLAHRETNNMAAYDAFLRGWEHYKRTTPDDFTKALAYFEESAKLDPIYARANAALALLYWRASMLGWQRRLHYVHFQQSRFQARTYLALAMKEPTSVAYQVSALISLFQRLHQQAITDADKALSLAPNDPYSHFIMAMILNYAGQYEKATNYVERAMRLDPQWETSIWGMRWFKIPLRDVKYCAPVFRNPQGRPEKLNEYLEIPVWAIYPWSIEE
jgi:adenylate cyclase